MTSFPDKLEKNISYDAARANHAGPRFDHRLFFFDGCGNRNAFLVDELFSTTTFPAVSVLENLENFGRLWLQFFQRSQSFEILEFHFLYSTFCSFHCLTPKYFSPRPLKDPGRRLKMLSHHPQTVFLETLYEDVVPKKEQPCHIELRQCLGLNQATNPI